jgi:hypothetical protein
MKIKNLITWTFAAILFAFSSSVALSTSVFAADPADSSVPSKCQGMTGAAKITCIGACKADPSSCEEDVGGNLTTTIQNIIRVIMWAVGLIAVFMVIFGGIQYATSAGDSGKTKKAKNTIMYGLIGLVIALLAFTIVEFVLSNIFKSTTPT